MASEAGQSVHETVVDVVRLIEEVCDDESAVASAEEDTRSTSLGLHALFSHTGQGGEGAEGDVTEPTVTARPARAARAPAYLSDYEW